MYTHVIDLRSPSSLVAQTVKKLPAMWETWVQSQGREDPLEKGTGTGLSILAWRILWTEEPSGLLSIRSHRIGHDCSDLACMHACIALEKEMATHSSILAWRILWTEEPGGLQSMGLHRVGLD